MDIYMIQYIVVRPGPARIGDWRANPYLCGQTDEPVRNHASRTIDIIDDGDDKYDDIPF